MSICVEQMSDFKDICLPKGQLPRWTWNTDLLRYTVPQWPMKTEESTGRTVNSCLQISDSFHSGNVSSSSVNGDIAIQWEWSNFDPSQNPNPSTDYDKTLHNWLRPRDEHVTQNLCQSAVRERLAKYVEYKASFYFYFYFIFSRTRLLKQPVHGISRQMSQNTRCDVRKCLLGSTRRPTTFWGSNSPKTVKNGLL